MKEIWKDVVDYEGLYQVSNWGRIKSLPRNGTILQPKILKIKPNKLGYLGLGLYKNNKRCTFRVHRLVATTFIPNPNNLPQVNHIDGNKQNNCVDNLEWCTASYNIKEAYRLGLAKPTWLNKKGCNHNCSKCINQYDLQGNFIKTWSSIIEAGSMFASNRAPANISCALRKNKRKTAYGYIWKYAD